jgi:adenylate cyclase
MSATAVFRAAVRPVLAGIVAAVVTIALVALGRLEPVEFWSLAQLFEFRGVRSPTTPVVIVTIDESSMAELHLQWPFPRSKHAELLRKIAAGKPLAIGVDLIFDAPSPSGPREDEALGDAVALAGNVVLGAAPSTDDQGFYRRETLNGPIPEIRRGAAAVAAVNLITDVDGHIRRAPLRVPLGTASLSSFDAELYRVAVQAGLPARPLPTAKTVLINFRGGPNTFPWVPYYRVVYGEIPSEVFHDKIVLIGPTSEVLHDTFLTVFARGGNGMPGVEIHANVLETYFRGNAIHEVPLGVSTMLAAAAAIVGSALVVRLHAVRALVATILLWTVLTAGVFLGFRLADVWMREMAGTLALVLGYGATVIEHFIREQREKRRLSQFFSPDVVKHVVRVKGTLGSNRRLVTVLFSDLRGFTSMSEKLQPEQVAEILQEYLTEMTQIVFRHGGTVDKYIGDCIMALWNAPFADPNHAANAVRTGLEFQERTLEVSKKWEERLGITIRSGVGINTGEAVVGTMGSKQRLEYTAIGDTINLGARLESITKDYGASIIISESTYEYVAGRFLTRELGAVTVKGKTRPVKIFAVVAEDLRKHPRTVLAAAATATALDSGRRVAVRVTDLSEGGLALEGVPADWDRGQTIQIRCDGAALPKPLVVEATITWRRQDRAGADFRALSPEAAAAVAENVALRARP